MVNVETFSCCLDKYQISDKLEEPELLAKVFCKSLEFELVAREMGVVVEVETPKGFDVYLKKKSLEGSLKPTCDYRKTLKILKISNSCAKIP